MTFTLGLAQTCHPQDGDVIALVKRTMSLAKTKGVDLLVFPESLMTRYEAERQSFLAAAEPLDGPYCQAIDALACANSLWVVYTVNEFAGTGLPPYNTVVLTDAQGNQQGVYRKVHLFDTDFTQESDRMTPGTALFTPLDTPFCRIGLSICYDLRFPEVARTAALQGCQLLINPAAWVDGPHKAHQWKTLLTARAIENEMFVAGVSRADAGYIGQSVIVDPLGRVLAEGSQGEDLLTASIDVTVMDDIRARMPVFDHRQPSLYANT